MQHCKFIPPPKTLQRMKNNIGLTFIVGDTIPWLTISIDLESVTSNVIFSGAPKRNKMQWPLQDIGYVISK